MFTCTLAFVGGNGGNGLEGTDKLKAARHCRVGSITPVTTRWALDNEHETQSGRGRVVRAVITKIAAMVVEP